MGGVCSYGEIYRNANLSSYLLLRGSCRQPPPPHNPSFVDRSTSLWPMSWRENCRTITQFESRSSICHIFFSLLDSHGLVDTLIEFASYNVSPSSCFLNGNLFLIGFDWKASFWIGQQNRGGYGNSLLSCSSCYFFIWLPRFSVIDLFAIGQWTSRSCFLFPLHSCLVRNAQLSEAIKQIFKYKMKIRKGCCFLFFVFCFFCWL